MPPPFPPDLRLRQREAGDTADLYTLLNQRDFQHSGSLLRPFASVEAVQQLLDSYHAGSVDIVATVQGRLVGYAGVYILDGRQDHIGFVTMGVDEDFRRRGIGTVLLRAIVATGRLLIGLRKIQLHVFVDNVGALALYRACGFRIEGRLSCFAQRDEGLVDAYAMALLFDGADPRVR